MTKKLIHALADMQEADAVQRARQLLDEGTDPMTILEACSQAMETVGNRFESGEYFLPHLVMAGEIMRQISESIKPLIREEQKSAGRGRILIGTVKGDIHDIGKNIVTFLLEANGFEVLDIGVDQAPEKFLAGIADFKPQVVGLSGLLTLAFESMKETIGAFETAGCRDEFRVIIGGGQVTEQIRDYTGADAFGADAVAGVKTIKQWIGGA